MILLKQKDNPFLLRGEKLVLIDVQIDSAENLLVIKIFCEVFQLYEFVHSCAPFRP